MSARFCTECGAGLWRDANFCAECGTAQGGVASRRPRPALPLDRYAPVLVILAVIVIGGAAVVSGVLAPKPPPSIPGSSPSEAARGSGELPQGHPPIEIPEQVRQAIRDLKTEAEAAPDDVTKWTHLAEVQYRAGQLDPTYLSDAAAAFRHVLERQPDNLEVMRHLGNVAFDQNQPDIAAGYYQRYLAAKPDDLNVRTDLGTMYLSSGKTEDAIRTYESVMEADPKFFQAQFNLAIAYRTLGDEAKATAALDKASQLASDERSRDQVNQLLARFKGVPAPVAGAAPAAPADGEAGTFQSAAAAIFRKNPILGPKVQRIEWQSSEAARVYLRDFPMEQMDEAMRSMFLDRMRGRIREQKTAHDVTQTARFDLVDEPTGTVMESITE
jgi:hypothetical protein